MTTRRSLLAGAASLGAISLGAFSLGAFSLGGVAIFGGPVAATPATPPNLVLSQAEWRERLSPEQFDILRQAGTEAPFSSPLDAVFAPGRYDCVGCGHKLYSSRTKFDSHTGWPSFWEPLAGAVGRKVDSSFLMERTEVHCANCNGHLGHVFDDGPKPTGLRYCMNGAVLNFVKGVSA